MFGIPAILAVAFPTVKAFVMPLVRFAVTRVPMKVWIGIGCAIGLLWFAHWNSERGYARCQANVAAAVSREKDRVEQAQAKVLRKVTTRALDAERRAGNLQERVDDANDEASKVTPGPCSITVPGSVTDRLRRIK